MTAKKLVRPQRSGHCESNAPGGHQRCRYVINPRLNCACGCHTQPTTEDRP